MLRAMILLTAAFSLRGAERMGPPTMSVRQPHELAEAYAIYKFMGSRPLPLRQAHEDWTRSRLRMQADPSLRKWLKDQQAQLDDWMTHGGDKANWVAGWSHNLVDSATGLPVQWSLNMPEPANYTSADKKIHGAWVMMVRTKNIKSVADAVRLWKLTGNAADLDWATRQLDFYASAYGSWPVQTLNGRSQMMGQSLDEATSGMMLVDAVRIIGDAVPSGRRQHWRQGLFTPMLANLRASNLGVNNIAVWQAAATAVIATELGDQTSFADAIDGENGIRAMLKRGITPDYIWFESSTGYGQYTQRALAELFLYLSLIGKAGIMEREMLLTQNMITAQASMRYSDGSLPVVGDTVPGIKAFEPSLLSITQRTMPVRIPTLPIGWDTVIDSDMPTASTPTEHHSRLWPSYQAAMLRRNGWELFTSWGQHSASHAQADALSYELRYNGNIISGAPGTANYGSSLFLTFLRTGAAHNQPLIDGEGETKFGPGNLVSADETRIVATHPGFVGASVSRTLALDEHGAAVTTHITSNAGLHRLGDVFNTPCRAIVDKRNLPSQLVAPPPVGKGFSWWKMTNASQPTTAWSTTLLCGTARFVLSLNTSEAGRVLVSSTPDRDGKLTRTAIYFEAPSATALTLNWRFASQ